MKCLEKYSISKHTFYSAELHVEIEKKNTTVYSLVLIHLQ